MLRSATARRNVIAICVGMIVVKGKFIFVSRKLPILFWCEMTDFCLLKRARDLNAKLLTMIASIQYITI